MCLKAQGETELSVYVQDFEGNPISKAAVTLMPFTTVTKIWLKLFQSITGIPRELLRSVEAIHELIRSETEVMGLKFEQDGSQYTVRNVLPGTYIIYVKSTEFDGQAREIRIGNHKAHEFFVLGLKDMPHYYRGNVKVPFKPHGELVGVSVKIGISAGELDELVRLASSIGLRQEGSNKQILENNVRIFAFTNNIGAENKREVLRRLSEHPLVKFAGQVMRIDNTSIAFLTSQIMVKLKSGITRNQAFSYFNEHQLTVVREIPYIENGFLLDARTEATYEVLGISALLMEESGIVEIADNNLVITPVSYQVKLDDHLYEKQWHIPIVKLPDAWNELRKAKHGTSSNSSDEHAFGSPDMVIAIMDWGIQSCTRNGRTFAIHPDLSGIVSNGKSKVCEFYDFENGSPDNNNPSNEHHGSKCAGVASALANNPPHFNGNAEGIVGAAPNCRIMGLKIPTSGPEMRYYDALVWASGLMSNWLENRQKYTGKETEDFGKYFPDEPPIQAADIIVNSYTYRMIQPSGIYGHVLRTLAKGRNGKGVVLIFAAGNESQDVVKVNPLASRGKYSSSSQAIVVAASTINDSDEEVRAQYSNYGEIIDVCAPSSDTLDGRRASKGIVTCHPVGNLLGNANAKRNEYTADFGGTSASAPLVAGIVALMLSANPNLTSKKVRQILIDTADKIDTNNRDIVGSWLDKNENSSTEPFYQGPHFSNWYGYGRVNAHKAVKKALLS
jgi:hypothetical protein